MVHYTPVKDIDQIIESYKIEFENYERYNKILESLYNDTTYDIKNNNVSITESCIFYYILLNINYYIDAHIYDEISIRPDEKMKVFELFKERYNIDEIIEKSKYQNS